MSRFVENMFSLPAWIGVSLVFFFPAAEASIFLGFVFPGEIAVVLGGVMAFRGDAPLFVILLAAISGAVIGDSIGYFVGKKWGRRVLDSTLGRFVKADHLDRGQVYLAEKGGKAVFFGRWTAALRALVPGLAGMSEMPYRKFLVWNFLGGTVWATTFVLLGHAAGNSYRHLENRAHQAGWVAFGVVIAVGLAVFAFKKARARRVAAEIDAG